MDLYEIMKKRRSTRTFSPKHFPQEKLNKVLQAGMYAPSGADQKPYVYIVVDDPAVRQQIRERCEDADKRLYESAPKWFKNWAKEKQIFLKKEFLTDAPYLVAVAGETSKPYWLESTWISIAYILLAAENEGLATLTYTPAETDFLNKLLNLPVVFRPVVMIPVGYAKYS